MVGCKKSATDLDSLTICFLWRQDQEPNGSIRLTYSRRLHDTPVAQTKLSPKGEGDSSLYFLQLNVLRDEPGVVEYLTINGFNNLMCLANNPANHPGQKFL